MLNAVVVDAIAGCKALTARYVVGFTDENCTRQAPGLPNHVAWSLGHLALTMHKIAEKIDGRPAPVSDFAAGAQGAGGAFGTESVAFGSKPVDERGVYPPLSRCTAVYEAACDRLAAAVAGATEAKLAEEIPWGAAKMALGAAAMRMVFHNGMHTGQIADLRRALGFKSIFS